LNYEHERVKKLAQELILDFTIEPYETLTVERYEKWTEELRERLKNAKSNAEREMILEQI
jgi:hypothetical protein